MRVRVVAESLLLFSLRSQMSGTENHTTGKCKLENVYFIAVKTNSIRVSTKLTLKLLCDYHFIQLTRKSFPVAYKVQYVHLCRLFISGQTTIYSRSFCAIQHALRQNLILSFS